MYKTSRASVVVQFKGEMCPYGRKGSEPERRNPEHGRPLERGRLFTNTGEDVMKQRKGRGERLVVLIIY